MTTEHEFEIIVNGQEKTVRSKEVSFADIVALAALPSGPNTAYTVTYRRGEGSKPEGSLVEGASAKVKKGMIFNVTATDRS